MVGRKLAATLVVLLWWLSVFFVYLETKGGSFLHTYHHWLEPFRAQGASFTIFSRAFAFPVVGLDEYADIGPWLYACFWSMVVLLPFFLIGLIWWQSERAQVDSILVYGLLPYAALVAFAGLLVVYGLWLPFSLI